MSEDNLLKLPNIQGGGDKRTPVSDKKRLSLEKRLLERVHLTDRQYADNGDIQGFCPMHEDAVASNKPSGRFNPTYNYWVCFAPGSDDCAEQGSNANLEKMLRKLSGSKVSNDNVRSIGSAKSKKASSVPGITEAEAAQFCNNLQKSQGVLNNLEIKRLWDERTIQDVGIGIVAGDFMPSLANKVRFTIPVYDSRGKYQGCRIYDALGNGGSGDNKFFWSGGDHDKDAIFRPRRRKNLAERVVILEGEPDAILATQDFRGYKGKSTIEFVSGTRGSKVAWPHTANHMLKNRRVYVCLDNDDAGDAGVKKLLASLQVGGHVQDIYVMRIPESRGVKDWTDYRRQVVTDPHVARQTMTALMDDAEHVYSRSAAEAEHHRMVTPPDSTELADVRIENAAGMNVDAKGAKTDVTILGRAGGEVLVATKVDLSCSRNKGKKCDFCPLGMMTEGEGHGGTTLNYYAHQPSILGQIEASDEQKLKKYRIDSDAQCGDIKADDSETIGVNSFVIQDSTLSESSHGQDPKQHIMYLFGPDTIDGSAIQNVHYKPSSFWKNSDLVIQCWKSSRKGSDLDSFTMTEKSHDKLKKLMSGSTVRQKLEEIAADYAWNVTSIFGGPRNLLHILVDLAYHSIRRIPFEGQRDMKGWLDVMVMGDSHTGKSATTRRIAEFYGCGEVMNGGGSTRSGVLAGVARTQAGQGGTKYVKKGSMVRNHRGLLVMEESHRMLNGREDIIGLMADARDNGQFNLTTINEATFASETRLIWIANPPGDMSTSKLSDFPYGASSAITQMMGGRENITRFTTAIGVSEEEVRPEESARLPEYEVKARFSKYPKAMARLVQWAWSRRPEHIDWEDGVQDYVRRKGMELASITPDEFPIANSQDAYAKVARVAAAVAARVYSTPDGVRLVIKKRHVSVAFNLMVELYRMESIGMDAMHKSGVMSKKAQESNKDQITKLLIEKHAIGICQVLADGSAFDVNSLSGTTGMSAFEVAEIMKTLQTGSYLKPDESGRRVRPTRTLMDVAKEVLPKLDRSGKTVKPKSARASDSTKLASPIPRS